MTKKQDTQLAVIPADDTAWSRAKLAIERIPPSEIEETRRGDMLTVLALAYWRLLEKRHNVPPAPIGMQFFAPPRQRPKADR
jgi:hypothetical protein